MIAQWLAGLFSRSSGPRKQPGRRTNPHRKSVKTATPFRSVSIVSTGEMCPAAERTSEQIFLAAHAPQLPLAGCNGNCKCRYKYHTDRRQDARRDQDVGLPGRPYGDAERRYRRDRRRRSPAKRTA